MIDRSMSGPQAGILIPDRAVDGATRTIESVPTLVAMDQRVREVSIFSAYHPAEAPPTGPAVAAH
jgi:hypothetical protein